MELILVSYIADLFFGDPQWFPHPVRGIGKLIDLFDRTLNTNTKKAVSYILGMITTFLIVGISGLSAYVVIQSAVRFDPLAGKIAWVFVAYSTLATKDLSVHALAVYNELVKKNIGRARKKLSFIVGRTTANMPEEEIIRSTVETVAENTTDGIISPLFYLFIGGPVLAFIFKAISTLDSMIGYKNERYLYFGRFAAKLDDAANYIPARITGLLIPLAALLTGKDARAAFFTMLRDARKQDSPNSAASEAAMAGALGIRLGGQCSYQGKIVQHPYLGEEKKPVSQNLIKEAIVISIVTSFLAVISGSIIKTGFS